MSTLSYPPGFPGQAGARGAGAGLNNVVGNYS